MQGTKGRSFQAHPVPIEAPLQAEVIEIRHTWHSDKWKIKMLILDNKRDKKSYPQQRLLQL